MQPGGVFPYAVWVYLDFMVENPSGLKSYHLIMLADWGFADVWGQFWVRLNCLDMESKPKHMLTPGLGNWGQISRDTLDIIHRGGFSGSCEL